MEKIAIQGVKGCFHYIAASDYFKTFKYKILECTTFKSLVESVSKNEANAGVMAIENSIAGTILSNYSLLFRYKLKIIGEVYLPIHHELLALENQNLDDIQEIISHPMAILQCEKFLDQYPNIKVSEYYDTAGAVQYIIKKNIKKLAAIAPKNIIKIYNLYNLKILATDIQTISNNFTRFFIIIANDNKNFLIKKFDKASFSFKLSNITGSLVKILYIISKLKINITKITSIPIIEKPWEYIFFIDIVFHDLNIYKEMKKYIREKTKEFYIVGEYKNKKI